jgi:hypothetical protein
VRACTVPKSELDSIVQHDIYKVFFFFVICPLTYHDDLLLGLAALVRFHFVIPKQLSSKQEARRVEQPQALLVWLE